MGQTELKELQARSKVTEREAQAIQACAVYPDRSEYFKPDEG